MTKITITLPYAYNLLNVVQRKSTRWRRNFKIQVAGEIHWQLVAAKTMPQQPMKRAKIVVERYSSGRPDHDGLVGGFKDILDCLTTPVQQKKGALKNKFGIGLIVDDSMDHIETEYRAIKVKPGQAKTIITITEILSDSE